MHHDIWQSRRPVVRNEKPAVVCVYRFQLQTHTSQEKPFIRINILSSGWSPSPQTFLLFCISAYLHQIQVFRLEFDGFRLQKIQIFFFFCPFHLFLWVFVETGIVEPEISVKQTVNIKKHSVLSHLAVTTSSSLLMISVSYWSFVSKLHSLKCRYLTAVSIPAMKSGQKAHPASHWDEQMRS